MELPCLNEVIVSSFSHRWNGRVAGDFSFGLPKIIDHTRSIFDICLEFGDVEKTAQTKTEKDRDQDYEISTTFVDILYIQRIFPIRSCYLNYSTFYWIDFPHWGFCIGLVSRLAMTISSREESSALPKEGELFYGSQTLVWKSECLVRFWL